MFIFGAGILKHKIQFLRNTFHQMIGNLSCGGKKWYNENTLIQENHCIANKNLVSFHQTHSKV